MTSDWFEREDIESSQVSSSYISSFRKMSAGAGSIIYVDRAHLLEVVRTLAPKPNKLGF
jgi:hypothetical protein